MKKRMQTIPSRFLYNRSTLRSHGSVFLLLFFLLLFSSCQKPSSLPVYTAEERSSIDSLLSIYSMQEDSLQACLQRYTAPPQNYLGVMLTYKSLGVHFRETARFNEAIEAHRSELILAEQLHDTLEMVQALNNIGTNFRRMGILDEASTYHYQALSYSDHYSDKTSYTAKKNQVVSLSGIGCIYLSLNNLEAADSTFRMALAGEKELGSALGQAMNYATIGSAFERRGQIDSAWVYYHHSMEYNRLAESNIGIALCHDHFGRLYESQKSWDEALKEYKNAYDIMASNRDRWHRTKICISLARVNISRGNLKMGQTYLDEGEQIAKELRAWEHLSIIYYLKYLFLKQKGAFEKALNAYVLSCSYSDSISSTKNLNHLQNLRIKHEKERNSKELKLIKQNYEMAQRSQNIILTACILVLSLAVIALVFLWYALNMKSRSQFIMRQMEQVRNRFFTNITHEFRTPLTVILGLSQQIQEESSTLKDCRIYSETILRQGKNLLELVNQLLDISKVKSEVGEPEWRNGDVVTYIRMMVESYYMYARQKRINLDFIPERNSIMMDFVPEYLNKIIRNILSNAFKFTKPNGRIFITTAQEKEELVISIADTGEGIDSHDLPHIFDTFYQGENSHANMGTGIGLSLVRQMTESMGGRVTVKSAKGTGSIFILNFPLKHNYLLLKKWIPASNQEFKRTDPLNETPATEHLSNEKEGCPSILIVEDNPDVAYYISALLQDTYQLFRAGNGEEGLEKAKEYMPDLIITDLMMPCMDGYEMCREVRHSPILNHIPIIIITAKVTDSDRIAGLEAGADAYLRKPFNADELQTRINGLLEQRRLLAEKYSQALSNSQENCVDLSPQNKEFLHKLSDFIYASISDSSLNSDVIADRMCMSVSQLNRKTRAITGFHCTGYILQMRIERAKRLLASTETLVGDIAASCGFMDSNYFSRIFKQLCGITPSQYRRNPKR